MTNLTTLASQIHADNRAKGFWDEPRSLCETTMLIVTELAEAVEEDRAGRAGVWYLHPDGVAFAANDEDVIHRDGGTVHHRNDLDGVPDFGLPLKPEGVDVELIDALIRLLDLLGSRGTDVDELLKQKLAYNREGRGYRHGKAY